jgi:Pectate lyase superfamily protein
VFKHVSLRTLFLLIGYTRGSIHGIRHLCGGTVRNMSVTLGSALIVLALDLGPSVNRCMAGESNLLNVVTDFGADPTGVNDSTIEFQSLFDQIPNGWQGYVPVGTYKISSGLVINSKTGIRIVGAAGGSFGSPILSWTGGAGGTVITLEGTSYSSLEHLFIVESNNQMTGSGRIGICVDTDTSPSSHDRFEDIQCRAPSIAGFRFGGINAQDAGHHVFVKDNVLCDSMGADAYQFLDAATVFNRIVAGETSECDRSLEIEGGSVSVIGLDFEYDTATSIHVGNANAPITLYSSQIESLVKVLDVDGPANEPLPILVKNWRVAVASVPSFAFQNQSLGPLILESNLLETANNSAPYVIGTGTAFASGSTLLSLGNYYTLDPLSTLNSPFGPGPERLISIGDVGVTDALPSSPLTIELSTIIEGQRSE